MTNTPGKVTEESRQEVKPLTLDEALRLTRGIKRWACPDNTLDAHGFIESKDQRFAVTMSSRRANLTTEYSLSIYAAETPGTCVFEGSESSWTEYKGIQEEYQKIRQEFFGRDSKNATTRQAQREEATSKLRALLEASQ